MHAKGAASCSGHGCLDARASATRFDAGVPAPAGHRWPCANGRASRRPSPGRRGRTSLCPGSPAGTPLYRPQWASVRTDSPSSVIVGTCPAGLIARKAGPRLSPWSSTRTSWSAPAHRNAIATESAQVPGAVKSLGRSLPMPRAACVPDPRTRQRGSCRSRRRRRRPPRDPITADPVATCFPLSAKLPCGRCAPGSAGMGNRRSR